MRPAAPEARSLDGPANPSPKRDVALEANTSHFCDATNVWMRRGRAGTDGSGLLFFNQTMVVCHLMLGDNGRALKITMFRFGALVSAVKEL